MDLWLTEFFHYLEGAIVFRHKQRGSHNILEQNAVGANIKVFDGHDSFDLVDLAVADRIHRMWLVRNFSLWSFLRYHQVGPDNIAAMSHKRSDIAIARWNTRLMITCSVSSIVPCFRFPLWSLSWSLLPWQRLLFVSWYWILKRKDCLLCLMSTQ